MAVIAVWFAALLLFGVKGIMDGQTTLALNLSNYRILFQGWWPTVIGPAILACFSAALLAVSGFLSRGDAQFLIEFLHKTIDARESAAMQQVT
jgi:hypothetical protein